jgi:glycosyltransferase involved in cell wall biosynthesis
MLWEQLLQPVALVRRRIDVLHSLGYVQPMLCSKRSVVTVHDLSFLRFPEAFNRSNRNYLRLFTTLSVRRANRVIAVSESTKRDLVDLLGIPAAKITVVYHGVEEEFRPFTSSTIADFRCKLGLPEHFVLYCGTLEPRKNVDGLIAAFAKVKREARLPHKLVLAGAKGWRYERIFALVEELGLKDEVIFPGYLAYGEQPLWYNAADVFVYPSLYEGFGFPPLEAMACGTPVISSDVSSLPEVVGDAGLLVDPGERDELADAIRKVLMDHELRLAMGKAGLLRASEFTWSRAAARTVEVYQRT